MLTARRGFRDSAVSLTGVAAAQIAWFVCLALIGRMRGPDVLGAFSAQLALATFGGTLLALRYELACMSDSPRESFNACVNVLALAACFAVVAGAVAIGAADGFAFGWQVVLAFATVVQSIANGYLGSLRRFGWIAICRVAVSGAFLAGLLAAAAASVSTDALALYGGASASVALAALAAVLLHGWRAGHACAITLRFFVESVRFPVYVLPSTLCGAVLTYALPIGIPSWFDADDAGYFAAAYRFGFFPVTLIGLGVGAVFRRDALAAATRGDAHGAMPRVHAKYARVLVGLALAYVVAGVLAFDSLIEWCFGDRWRPAVAFYYCLAPLFGLQMIYVPLSQIFLAVRAQRADFLFQLASGALLIGALVVARLAGFSILSSVRLFACVGALTTAAGIALTYVVANDGATSGRRTCASPFRLKEEA